MKNKYLKRAHIRKRKFREVLKFFTSVQIANLSKVNRSSIDKIIKKIRYRIYELCLKENPLLEGEIECDESYFGAKIVREIRGRAAKGKIKVFGLLKREAKVYTEIVNDVSAKTLQG